MTVSVTSWKSARADAGPAGAGQQPLRLALLPSALLSLCLAGCASAPPPPAAVQPAPTPATAATTPAAPASAPARRPAPLAPAANAPAAVQAPAAAATGLTPLPSPASVLAAAPSGRVDPFSPQPGFGGLRAAAPVRLQLPADFRFSGVMRSAGQPLALVQFGANSGALSVGERGGQQTELLPNGWAVAAIDVDRGVLTLRQGKQLVTAEL